MFGGTHRQLHAVTAEQHNVANRRQSLAELHKRGVLSSSCSIMVVAKRLQVFLFFSP